eukprot:symbB.v1.2.002195.t1/scaffold96.1/size336774/12
MVRLGVMMAVVEPHFQPAMVCHRGAPLQLSFRQKRRPKNGSQQSPSCAMPRAVASQDGAVLGFSTANAVVVSITAKS